MVKFRHLVLLLLPFLAVEGHAQTVSQHNLEQGALQYTWSTSLKTSTAIDVELKLAALITVGARENERLGLNTGLTIDLTTLSGIAPSCLDLHTNINKSGTSTGQLFCTIDRGSEIQSMGSAGGVHSLCKQVTRPVYREELVCRDSNPLCREPLVGEEPDIRGGGIGRPMFRPGCTGRPLCTKKKVFDHNEIDRTCEEKSSKLVFEVDDFRPVADKLALKTYTSIHSFETTSTTRVNGVAKSSSTVNQPLSHMDLDIEIPFSMQLRCADGSTIGTPWNTLHEVKEFSYQQIFQACPNKDVRLVSSRPMDFARGQLIMTFEKTNEPETEE